MSKTVNEFRTFLENSADINLRRLGYSLENKELQTLMTLIQSGAADEIRAADAQIASLKKEVDELQDRLDDARSEAAGLRADLDYERGRGLMGDPQ